MPSLQAVCYKASRGCEGMFSLKESSGDATFNVGKEIEMRGSPTLPIVGVDAGRSYHAKGWV
jgi:hypothetical protein